MAFNIGDKVTTASGLEAVVTDKMYSEKKSAYYYGIQYKGMIDEEEDLFEESQLQPYTEEPPQYKVETTIEDGVVVVEVFEITKDNKTIKARGHAHIMHNGALGIVQATSYASRRALLSINNNSVYVEKEI